MIDWFDVRSHVTQTGQINMKISSQKHTHTKLSSQKYITTFSQKTTPHTRNMMIKTRSSIHMHFATLANGRLLLLTL